MKNKERAKILAQSIYRALLDKNKTTAQEIVDNFLVYLKKHHYLFLLNLILAELKNLEYQKKNILAVEITSARVLDKNILSEISKYLKKKSDQEIVLSENIDTNLLAGLKIKYQDQVLDLSLKKQINNLNKSLVN